MGSKVLGSQVFGPLPPSASPFYLIWISQGAPVPWEKQQLGLKPLPNSSRVRVLIFPATVLRKETPNFKYYELFANNFILKETWPVVC